MSLRTIGLIRCCVRLRCFWNSRRIHRDPSLSKASGCSCLRRSSCSGAGHTIRRKTYRFGMRSIAGSHPRRTSSGLFKRNSPAVWRRTSKRARLRPKGSKKCSSSLPHGSKRSTLPFAERLMLNCLRKWLHSMISFLCLSRRCRMRVTAGTTQVCSTRWLRRACRRTTSVLLSTFESLRDSRQKGRFARI